MSKKAREDFYKKQKDLDRKAESTASKIAKWFLVVAAALIVVEIGRAHV